MLKKTLVLFTVSFCFFASNIFSYPAHSTDEMQSILRKIKNEPIKNLFRYAFRDKYYKISRSDWGKFVLPLLYKHFVKNVEQFDEVEKEKTLQLFLLEAIEYNHQNLVKDILRFDFDLNYKDFYGNSTLHSAVLNGSKQIIYDLVESGVCLNIQDKEKNTPLQLILKYRRFLDLVMLFIKHGADLDVANYDGQTPRELIKKIIRDSKSDYFLFKDWLSLEL